MAQQVVMGALMQCSFGTAPCGLIVIPKGAPVMAGNMPTATIMDYAPIANIPSFAMCNSPANPATKRPPPVLFTPAPCMPVIPAPWVTGAPTVLINNFPALNNTSKCMCAWGGVINITSAGQFTVQIP